MVVYILFLCFLIEVRCKLGFEMVGVECKMCLNGYYRNQTDQVSCTPCPVGMTTYGKGNTDGICKGFIIIN